MDLKIKLNSAGVGELLRSPGVQADVNARAARIADAAAAGPGGGTFSHDIETIRKRAHATVRTADTAARRAEMNNRALTRAIDAGRG